MSIILNDLKTDIFENINLKLKENEKIAIIGQNGIGKTTLLRAILGLQESSGGITILNEELKKFDDFKKIYFNVGYLFQDSDDSFIASSVLDEVAFNLYNKTEEYESSYKKSKELLKEFRIEELQEKLPIKLSGGQKRIVAFCACIVHEPKVLLLDEPTNHLDKKVSLIVEEKLKSYQGNIIMVAHNIEFAKKVVDKFYELTPKGLFEVNI